MTAFPQAFIGGVSILAASRAQLTAEVIGHCLATRAGQRPPLLMFDANGHALSLAGSDPTYRAALEKADIIHSDGGFLIPVSKWIGGAPIPERSATTDLLHDFAEAGLAHGLTHYLLGGTEEVNAACAERLSELHRGLKIVGRRNGYFSSAEEEEEVINGINSAAPDLLWIGLGKPLEQLFAVRNRNRLHANWAITCGGCFNYVTGSYRRAPLWMRDMHLEWLFRAATTPKLISRYAVTSPHALWLALTRSRRRQL
jgi:exopolysaccharide biosynthesis WecB/TagA/CpsF family protein